MNNDLPKSEKINKIVDKLHYAANGYGLSKQDIEICIESIPEELLNDFIYTMRRIAEKSGKEGFNVERI